MQAPGVPANIKGKGVPGRVSDSIHMLYVSVWHVYKHYYAAFRLQPINM